MSWYLLVLFATSAQVIHVEGKAQCEALRAEFVQSYGKGTAFLDARCVSVLDGGRKP